jgi:hypothetical protein
MISPVVGGAVGGTSPDLMGTALGSATVVFFGANQCKPGDILTTGETQITVKAPPGTGSVVISVQTDKGAATSGVMRFSYE